MKTCGIKNRAMTSTAREISWGLKQIPPKTSGTTFWTNICPRMTIRANRFPAMKTTIRTTPETPPHASNSTKGQKQNTNNSNN